MSDKNIFQRNPKKALIIILVVFIIIIDFICAMLFTPRDFYCNDFRVPHSFYIHTLLPFQNCKSQYKVAGHWIGTEYSVKTNSLGFIDHSVRNVDLVSNKTRILLMGDSFTEGMCTNFDKSWAGLISQKFDNKKYEILDAGVGGYCPKNYYLKTKFLLEYIKLRFNKLVVCIDISDIQDELEWDFFVPSVNKKDLEYKYSNVKIKNFFRRHSFLYYSSVQIFKKRKVINRIVSTVNGLIGNKLKNNANSLMKFHVDRGMWSVDSVLFRDWGKKGLSLAEGHMDELYQLCVKNNIEMVVSVHPWGHQIIRHDLNSIQVIFWKQFCEKRNIKFINLFPLFINNTPPEEVIQKYYLQYDVHWTEAGHKLVADAMYGELSKLWKN